MPANPPLPENFPADLIAEFTSLKQRIARLLEAAADGAADAPALIDHLHRLGGAAGLFGEAALGRAAKLLGDRIEFTPRAVRPADYAALAQLIAASSAPPPLSAD